MYEGRRVCVVVPAFNEERLIERTLCSMPDLLDRIYVVDDGSSDRTAGLAISMAEVDERIQLIAHDRNMGVGAAIASGYRAALAGGMDVAVVMAGDDQMDPAAMTSLLDPIVGGRADYSKGNRLFSREYWQGMSRWRFIGNAMLTLLTKISSGYWDLMDPQNGYTAISQRALESIDLDSLYPGYGYCNDLLVKLNVYGFQAVDVVIPARYGGEKSKIKYRRYIPKVSLLLLCDFFWRLKVKYICMDFHPLVLFYILGVVLVPLGILVAIYSLYYKFVLGGSLFIRGVLSFLILILGMQSLLFAMLFDMQDNNREER
ncbi:MAG: glycosyltransferase family 2 protein [Methanotrichaceae archaeon]|nr:glycosyltransferase family 2 protein [Methanotrichaceae archaeon]